MKIGLVDVDGHTQKKKWGATVYPNLALCKIARYHKQSGDSVEWAIPFYHYDIIYMSKVFNFTPDDLTCYNADRIVKGGTGYDIASKLPAEIDLLQPDYSIYPNIPHDTAYGFLTRGCPNQCPWCVVPKKEGQIKPYMDCDQIAIEGRKKLVLMDNNILASGEYAKKQMSKIIDRGYCIDFNQACDARLVTNDFAQLMAKIKWIGRRIRFGCDTKKQIEECERAIRLINDYGFRGEYFIYTMIGGKDGLQESFERVNYWWLRNNELRKSHGNYIYPYVQPYRDPSNPRHYIPNWQKDMAQWVNKRQIFEMTDFFNYEPRKGFKCSKYFT